MLSNLGHIDGYTITFSKQTTNEYASTPHIAGPPQHVGLADQPVDLLPQHMLDLSVRVQLEKEELSQLLRVAFVE